MLMKRSVCQQREARSAGRVKGKEMARGGDPRRYCYREALPFAAMVAMECTNVGLNTLFKLATRHGMSRHVFLVYAYGVAAFVLLPSPFFSRRSPLLPSLNSRILLKIFLLGAVGYSSQIMGYTGIDYASPTLASAMSNLAPAFTFVLAIVFRMERVALSSRSSQAKILGTTVSILGALVMTLYQGPSINAAHSPVVSLHRQSLHSSQTNWMIGSLFLSVEYFLVPVWYILQTQIMKEYPAELTVVFFYTSFVSIIAAVAGVFMEPKSSQWIIKPNVALASMLCSGVLGCCVNNVVHTWALHLRGPVYVAMFKPLSIAIAAAMGVAVLGDTLYLGSIIGATIIAVGFYTVIWGKAKEEFGEYDARACAGDLESSTAKKHPLLQSYNSQVPTKW
ncbi:WAT1-related protein At3g28050-like [Andrographis paniculata]|uniref:WAT1-related protein At3g28050-like n=1 Tax=Andrographis paniculata TaxID=175694 RepID=UPI0021E8D189|nr:WAT1-related protein At3g28050-like [Andrographis paniculata]